MVLGASLFLSVEHIKPARENNRSTSQDVALQHRSLVLAIALIAANPDKRVKINDEVVDDFTTIDIYNIIHLYL